MDSLDMEDIAKKLELFHSHEDSIAAAKQEYNSSQMFHNLDEPGDGMLSEIMDSIDAADAEAEEAVKLKGEYRTFDVKI